LLRFARNDEERALFGPLVDLLAVEVVELLDQPDLPWRQAQAREAAEGIQIAPADRVDTEAVAAAPRGEPAEGCPDVPQWRWEWRTCEFGLVFGAPGRGAGAGQQARQAVAGADALVVGDVELEGLPRVVPQAFAEG
jgi:hypothetical protein